MTSVESLTAQAREHHRKGDYDSAMKCHQEALAALEETNGKVHMDTADRYERMGSVMDDAGEFDKAQDYFETAISILSQLGGDEAKLAQGGIFEAVGNILYKQEDYNGAIQKLTEALEILKSTDGADTAKMDEIEYLIEVANMMAD